jgi:hypothetical protein
MVPEVLRSGSHPNRRRRRLDGSLFRRELTTVASRRSTRAVGYDKRSAGITKRIRFLSASLRCGRQTLLPWNFSFLQDVD